MRGYVATVLSAAARAPSAPRPTGTMNSWISELLSHDAEVVDWDYLSAGGQLLTPTEKLVPDEYAEGDFLRR